MDIFGILSMLGGLALFLYGMLLLSQGLEKLSGGRLEQILEKLTSNPIKAVFLGGCVTALIQSSSATTVMVVGFVNSGIMKLSQAVGIIMGANIGTTVTAWILSLAGIEGDQFFVQLLKPSTFSPVLAMVGIVCIMMSKREKQKDIGTILLGFAILMYGMDSMSSAVKPLAHVPEFTNLLLIFQNPVMGIVAGAILTAIIQSSSASVGILQALASTGSIRYTMAIPIIMGQNIGTCITAIISSIGASKNARRTALIHLYFNVIGTMVFMIIFYFSNRMFHFSFVEDIVTPSGIAVVHSIFNITATILLLPFAKGLEKLAYMTIKDTREAQKETRAREFDKVKLLDERFLTTPGFAVAKCIEMTRNMAFLASQNVGDAIELRKNYSKEIEERVIQSEEEADRYEDALGSYLMKLNGRDLSGRDGQIVTMLLHCIGDFERISDHALNIMKAAKELNEKSVEFSSIATEEITVMETAVREILTLAIEAFCQENIKMAESVEPLEEVIDSLKAELKKRHVKRLREGKCTVELGFVWTDFIHNYERIADHCSNIAVCMIELKDNSFDTHEYLNELRRTGNRGFIDKVQMYQSKYALP